MSFAKSKKVLHDQFKFNPPPGYYEHNHSHEKSNAIQFTKDQRFKMKIQNHNPGPGAYLNNDKEHIKKRLLQQANKKQFKPHSNTSDNNNDIKISSIPSIPKKSTTRVYEQLAPGILILHEEEYQNSNIGPGSYDVKVDNIRKKVPGTKILPEHKKKIIIDEEPDVKIPTMAEELRQQKRLLYKQNLYKSSNVNKNDINSSDLCLETIILRQKLLRGDDVPPPGFYYNQDVYSTFKKNNQLERPPELQVLGGKEERFKEQQTQVIGPGSYTIKQQIMRKGGVISKNTKEDIDILKKISQPGPGAYQLVPVKSLKQEPKGNYPPIFGSGCKRFIHQKQVSEFPGPGSYKTDIKKKKKVKYIKIRKDFYDTQRDVKPKEAVNNPLGLNNSKNNIEQKNTYYSLPHSSSHKQKNNHYFKSKVERFLNGSGNLMNNTGPGQYDTTSNQFVKNTFNRKKVQGYLGDKSQRFDDTKIRPNIGPGTYY